MLRGTLVSGPNSSIDRMSMSLRAQSHTHPKRASLYTLLYVRICANDARRRLKHKAGIVAGYCWLARDTDDQRLAQLIGQSDVLCDVRTIRVQTPSVGLPRS